MNRYYNRRDPVVPRRPKRIELSDGDRKGMIILLGVTMAAVMVFLLVYALSSIPTRAGWTLIESSQSTTGCQSQYVFQYNLGKNGSATVQNKAVSAIYGQATDDAWKALSCTPYEGVHNLNTLNRHPNEPVQVDSILYGVIEQLGDSRFLFWAPLYAYYGGLYSSTNDESAGAVDPMRNPEAAEYVKHLASFAANREDISLELMGEGRVQLHVSQQYLDFAAENELTGFLDFGWLRNAFVLDYAADCLLERGYPDGTISSYDGFTRSLGEESFSVNLFSLMEGVPREMASVQFTGPMTQVSFRRMPLYELDAVNYYAYQDGTIRGPYLGADGQLRSGCDSMLLLSQTQGCAALALAGLPVYTAEPFSEDGISGFNWVLTQGSTVHSGGTGFTVETIG